MKTSTEMLRMVKDLIDVAYDTGYDAGKDRQVHASIDRRNKLAEELRRDIVGLHARIEILEEEALLNMKD